MKPSQSGLQYPIFNWVCICPSKKLQILAPVQSDSEEEEEAEEEDVEEEE